MPKYIDADVLKVAMVFDQKTGNLTVREMRDILMVIDSVPAADVEEVLRGYWIEYRRDGQMACRCSACGSDPGVIYMYRRCPECGAHMDAEPSREENT